MQKGFSSILIVAGVLVTIAVIYLFATVIWGNIQPYLYPPRPCPNIISNYKNSQTGECRAFSGCGKIPTGWTVSSCNLTPSSTLIPNETANWKTYTNTNGFSLKYPSSMKVHGVGIEVNDTNAPNVFISTDPNNPSAEEYFQLYMEEISYTDKKGKTLQQIAQVDFNSNLNAKNNPAKVIVPLTQVTFADQPAFTYTILNNGYTGDGLAWTAPMANYKIIETIRGNQYYIIEISDNLTMNLILSTLKFTN